MEKGKEKEMPGILDGIRILDFTQVVAGPYCTRMLVDMGADVIKVEPPEGESVRYIPTFRDGVSGSFLQYNGGKKSLAIDLKKEEAKKLIKELVRNCDVVVENFAVGTMKRLGLDYDTLKKENEQLIMGSITGYGQTGPNKSRLGFAVVVQAATGITDLLAKSNPGDVPPAPHALNLADTIAGYHLAMAIVSALFYRERTGIGQYIDISMFDSLFFTIDNQVQHYLMAHTPPPRFLGATPMKGRDGQYFLLGFAKYDVIRRFLKFIGREELTADKRFSSLSNIQNNREDFFNIVNNWAQTFDSTDELERVALAARLPVSKIKTVVEAIESPQIAAREMLLEMDHPKIGKVKVMNSPIKFSETSSRLRGVEARIGEHNEYVMKEILHLSTEEVASLYRRGILWKK